MKKRQKILEKRLVSLTKPNKHQLTLKTDPKVNCLLKCEWITIWETNKCYLIFYDVTPSESKQKVKAKDESMKHISYLLVCILPVHDNWYNREINAVFEQRIFLKTNHLEKEQQNIKRITLNPSRGLLIMSRSSVYLEY